MSIYRSAGGRAAVRAFADDAIQDSAITGRCGRTWHDSALGPSHVLSVGGGPAVALLAGTNFCAATWLDLIGMLASTYRVHAIDLPGQPGLSDDRRPRRPSAYGHWLTRLLPLITDGPATLVGHSLGARVVLDAVAAGAPATGMVLVDPAGLMRLSVSPRVLRPTMPWLRRPDDDTSTALLRMMMAPGGTPSAHLVSWMTLVGRHVRTSLAPAPASVAAWRTVAATPAVVVAGVHDVFLPPGRLSQAAARRLPGATWRLVPDAGHLLPHERPDVVSDAVDLVT